MVRALYLLQYYSVSKAIATVIVGGAVHRGDGLRDKVQHVLIDDSALPCPALLHSTLLYTNCHLSMLLLLSKKKKGIISFSERNFFRLISKFDSPYCK
jgi:hypothetical protein